MESEKMTQLYLYKDKFLSGWGLAKRGSYVIADRVLRRKEFKFLGMGLFCEFLFGSGKDRNFQLWIGCKDEMGRPEKRFVLEFAGKNKPLKVGAEI